MLELGLKMINEQKKGCDDCADKLVNQILQLIILTEQLYKRIEDGDYGEETDKLYDCLLGAVAGFSGASLSLDPNAVNPNITIDVTIIGDQRPDWIDVDWEEMTNDVDGYRDTYFNTDWVGWNPMIQVMGVVMYQLGIDYDNDGQGNITFREGKGLYEGQYFRAGNYQIYTPPVNPVEEGSILLDNQSSQTITYSDNGGSTTNLGAGVAYGKNPITDGQSFVVNFPTGTTLTRTKYDGAGVFEPPLVLTNPNTSTYGDFVMEIELGWYYVVIDTPVSFPSAGKYRFVNGSGLDTTYSFGSGSIPLTDGEEVIDSFTLGQSILAFLVVDQGLTMNVYNSDGSLFSTLEVQNPPTDQLGTGALDLTKAYEFIYSNVGT